MLSVFRVVRCDDPDIDTVIAGAQRRKSKSFLDLVCGAVCVKVAPAQASVMTKPGVMTVGDETTSAIRI
jgi:hypothetical protein